MSVVLALVALVVFPGGLFVILGSLAYEYVDRKLVARFQNRVGPRWFQPLADLVKLLVKEEIVPEGVNRGLFNGLPLAALAGSLTAALYVPMAGLAPAWGFRGDLVVTVYLLMMMTLCIGLAGANTQDRFSLVGSTRALTQLFSYEAPFLLALLGPAIAAGTWRISEVNGYAREHLWMIVTQPLGFLVALIGLMGKLELPPFDAPEAETEIVSGALTEYSGRGLAFFRLGRDVELLVGLTLISAFYLGGLGNPLHFLLKTLALLFVTAGLQSLFARLRIDQTVGLWWRAGAVLALVQLLVLIVLKILGVPPVKIASMLNDVFVSLFKRPFTELYPYAVKPAPERLRGKLLWDESKCDGVQAVRARLPGEGHRDRGGRPCGEEVRLPLPHRPLHLLRAMRGKLQGGRPHDVQHPLPPGLRRQGRLHGGSTARRGRVSAAKRKLPIERTGAAADARALRRPRQPDECNRGQRVLPRLE